MSQSVRARPPVDGERFLRLRALRYRLSQSLFVVPAVLVAAALALAQIGLAIDRAVGPDSLPRFFVTTVESARSLLSSIAGGTITAASVVFSLTLVAVQLSSSQFSPRSIGTFLGDRFQQVVIGVVLGTFSYCLLVLREVRGPLVEDGESVVPALSVTVAVVLAIASLVSLMASINHTAQSLRVESVLKRLTASTIEVVRSRYHGIVAPPVAHLGDEVEPEVPTAAVFVAAPQSGWIQQLSARAMVEAVPEGTTVHLAASVGEYVIEGSPLAYVAPEPDDIEGVRGGLLRCVVIGDRRTLQQDIAFGLVQLDDVALRALSPGVNDPNTAVDVVARLGAVLVEILVTNPPSRIVEHEGRRLIRVSEPNHGDYVSMALDPIRRHARGEPSVLVALARTLARVRAEVGRRRPGADLAPLDRQIRLLRNAVDQLEGPADRELVLDALSVAS